MKRLVLSGLLVFFIVAGASAQKAGYDPVNHPYGTGQDSINCRMNLSLLTTSARAENYKDALSPWNLVYENCPAASKNTYIFGPRIFKSIFASETDPAKKQAAMDKVMEIYDARVKYFGHNESLGTVLAYKTYDYMELIGDKLDHGVVYEWLGTAIEDMKDRMTPSDAYSIYMGASLANFRNEKITKEQYIKDYFTITGYIDQAIVHANTDQDTATSEYLAALKTGIVRGFVSSGAGDCETLTNYYADKLEANKDNKEFLGEVLSALASINCTEEELYAKAGEYLYNIEPSANAAIGLASRALRDKDYESAIKYYQEAADMETDKSRSSEYMMQLAGIFSAQRNYPKSRQAAYKALEFNPNNGNAYILIAKLYASSASSIFPEAEKQGLVFCAAIDKLQKAKSVDPSVASEANSLISSYSAYFMDTETAFMMGLRSGESVFIPGWIGENVVIRLK